MRYRHSIVQAVALIGWACAAAGATPVQEFTGDRSADTPEFEVQAPWIVDWRVTGEYRTGASIEVYLVQAGTGVNAGLVLNTTGTGNGVKLFDESGRYYLRVNSQLVDWTLKVQELSDGEAERYTPKQVRD